MRLILKDYIETLKEEKELENLLENILIMNDFTDIIRPQKGVAQHGVDFSAQKDGEIYLFVLKQKDLDRTNWNNGNNAVRPTLDEIQDVYMTQVLNDCKQNINIVVCTNGIIKQNVKADWDGYVNRNATENKKYIFWGIDELTKLTEQFLLNEYLFTDEIKSDLRKSLYFFEEDINLNYYKELLNKLILKLDISKKGQKIYKKTLLVYMLVVKMCTYYAIEKNTKIAEKMAEKALILFWNFILQNNLYENEEEIEILILLSKQYESCCREYLKQIKLVYNCVPSFPIYNSLEYRITIYEVIGMISTFTYYLYYYYGETDEVVENINILITLINNNVAFFYPLYDLNSIEINTLIFLLMEVGNDQASVLVEILISKIISRMQVSKYYPVEYENYDKALQIEFNETIEECSASVLLTNLLEWLNIFEKKQTIKESKEYLYKKYPNITFNSIEIDLESEKEYFNGDIQNSLVTYVIDYNEKEDELYDIINQIYENNMLCEYDFYKYNALPFLFITARNYRMPLPSNIIYQYKKSNQIKDSKN